jgi:leucyl aminopeptidase (aminopeptidase T)
MNIASSKLLALSDQLVRAADDENWEEVSRLQKTIHELVQARDALKIYARKTLELVRDAIDEATRSTITRRDEIYTLVQVLSK